MTYNCANIETPAFVINEEIALTNIEKFQKHCDDVGLLLRPHIKTHKSIRFAKAQLAAGAIGITCQKISEAEVMAAGGIDDILITYNILGALKLKRLKALCDSGVKLQVTADNDVVIVGLADCFSDPNNLLGVLVECDIGGRRCGVQTPAQAAELAQKICNAEGLKFAGLMTYPAIGSALASKQFMADAQRILMENGINCPIISTGGSPDMWTANTLGGVTEYRIGTYIFNDRSLVERGTCVWDDCAAKIIATIVSIPLAGRAIIDAGSKMLTSDLLGLDGFGAVEGNPNLRIVSVSEEHGILEGRTDGFSVGDRVCIIPNHVCVVTNMGSTFWLEDDSGALTLEKVDARGCVL